MLTYVIPTRDRHEELALTLEALGRLGADAHADVGGAEIVVVDNASAERVRVPAVVGGMRVCLERLLENAGAAARNVGVELSRGGDDGWIVMLDDDSAPIDAGFVELLAHTPCDVAAVGGDIRLPGGARESGGLPEVFVGCGVALRRRAFVEVGGYDASFGYYAEEYDLAAKLIGGGWRVVHDARFRVLHRKAATGRSFDAIIERLVRNNGVVVHRYAPENERGWMLAHVIDRYGRIARKEGAEAGWRRGVRGLARALEDEERRPLGTRAWERFVGLAAAEAGLRAVRAAGVELAALVRRGKHDWCVEEAARRAGIALVADDCGFEGHAVIGTLSPGPMLDGVECEMRRGRWGGVSGAWTPRGLCCGAVRAAS